LIRYLFGGRLTLADTMRLAPLFDSGWLQQPRYLPTWAADLRRLSALLAFSAFIGKINLNVVSLERITELEEEIKGLA
jgi:hypothetical protein